MSRVSAVRALSTSVRMKVVLPDMLEPVSSSPVPSRTSVLGTQPSMSGCTTCSAFRYFPSTNCGRQVWVSLRRRATEIAASVSPMKRNMPWIASRRAVMLPIKRWKRITSILKATLASSMKSHAMAASSFAESPCVPTTRLRRSTSATCRICPVASSVPGTSSTASSRAVRNASESCFTAEP